MITDTEVETRLLQFSCSHCTAQLAVPESFAGVSAPCPHCRKTVTAPTLSYEETRMERHSQGRRLTAPPKGVALFEKRGFRPVRLVMSVAACVAIFMGFQALKSRRWELPGKGSPMAQIAAPPAPPTPMETEPESPPQNPVIQGVTPPQLPNLRTLSAGK